MALISCGEKDYVAPIPTYNKDTVDLGPLPDTGVWLFHSHHIPSAQSSDYDKNFQVPYITYKFTFDGQNIYSENDVNSIKDTGRWERRVVNDIKYYDIQFNGNDSLLTWYNDSWRFIQKYDINYRSLGANDKIFWLSPISILNGK